MNCPNPNCKRELLFTKEIEEQLLPYKEMKSEFPIQIAVIETNIYKCDGCGAIVKIPKIKYYIQKDK